MVDPIRPKTGPLQGPLPTPPPPAPAAPAVPEAPKPPAQLDNVKLSASGLAVGQAGRDLPTAPEHQALAFTASVEALAAQALHAGPEEKAALRDRVDELLQEGRELFAQSQTAIRGHMRKLEQLRTTLGDPQTAENARKTEKLSPQELAAELAKALRLEETLEKATELAEQAKLALEHDDGFQHMAGPVKEVKAGLEHLERGTEQLLNNCPPQLREAMEQLIQPARLLLGARPGLDDLEQALAGGAPSAELAARTLDALEGIARALAGLPDPLGAQARDLVDTAAAGRRALAGGGR
jgi:hypothetical protein